MGRQVVSGAVPKVPSASDTEDRSNSCKGSGAVGVAWLLYLTAIWFPASFNDPSTTMKRFWLMAGCVLATMSTSSSARMREKATTPWGMLEIPNETPSPERDRAYVLP